MDAATLTIQTPTAFTVREAAERLSVGPTTIYELLKRGELAAVRIGADRRIPADAIIAFLQRQVIGSGRTRPAHMTLRRTRRA